MKQLRNSILILFLVIGVFLNIERLDVGTATDVVDMQSFVYLLGLVIVVAHLLVEERWHPPLILSLAFWLGAYLLLKLTVFATRPLLGGQYTYLSITETAMLALVVVAASRLACDLHEIRETIANVTLEDVSDRVKPLEEAEREIAKEFARSRRYNVPLSVMVLKVDPGEKKIFLRRAAEELFEGLMERYAINRLMRVLDRELRRTDLVLDRTRDNEIVLVLPETDSGGTDVLAERVRQLVKERLGIDIAAGYASFPDEALTFDDLLQQAEKRFRLPANSTAVEVEDV